jgi:hypothetical protein
MQQSCRGYACFCSNGSCLKIPGKGFHLLVRQIAGEGQVRGRAAGIVLSPAQHVIHCHKVTCRSIACNSMAGLFARSSSTQERLAEAGCSEGP